MLTNSLSFLFVLADYRNHTCVLAAAPCIGPVRGFVCLCVCGWVCYHDNSKLRETIITKLSL